MADLVHDEAVQRRERASYTAALSEENHSRSSTKSDHSRSTFTPVPCLELLIPTYRPHNPSSMTPMERFATLSPANDPHPWESRRVMAMVGLEEGSTETLDVRVDAAIILDASRKSARSSCSSLAQSR